MNGHATCSVAAMLAGTARSNPDAVAIVAGDRRISYGDLWRQTMSYAGALRDAGVAPGDRVAVLVANVPDFPRVYYAILSLGAIVVPIHALLKSDEIAYVLDDSGARLLIVSDQLGSEGRRGAESAGVRTMSVGAAADDGPEDRLEELAAAAVPQESYRPMAPTDTATILYTSGTTGKPKGAAGSHFAIIEQVNTLLTSVFDVRAGDTLMGCLPLFHTFGQTCVLNLGLRAGATIVLLPRFEGAAALDLMVAEKVDVFFGVPTMYVALVDAAAKSKARPALRYGISGGAPLPVAIIDAFKEAYSADIFEGYGLTETSPVASFNHVGETPLAGSVGRAIWGVDIAVAASEEAGIRFLPTGELGEIVIRGHNLMQGYWNRPEDTDEAIVEGWFRSGDLGTVDESGIIRILDRKKDMILRNGYNVYPREVEEVLARHPAVRAVAVFGVDDTERGQEVAAAVVTVDGAEVSADELIAFARERIAAYKYPRIIRFMGELPTGSSGKVLKRVLASPIE